jgi:TonB family protein
VPLEVDAGREYDLFVCAPLFISLGFVLGSLFTVDPLYPPNAVSGGSVVAELHFAKGAVVNVTILSGEEPFADSCKSALAQWRMQSEQDTHELVVVNFRQPNLTTYSSSANKQLVRTPKTDSSLPYPKNVMEPAYPANAFGQGSVVLKMDITAEGRTANLQVVKPLGVLTNTSIDAVRQWEFFPRQDSKGAKIPSHAYAVLVFRFPILTR